MKTLFKPICRDRRNARGNKNQISLLNNRGVAIITALIVMTVLLLLGVAVTSLSLNSLDSSVVDASNNSSFYAAEAGVSKALAQLKYEASSYYNQMMDATLGAYTSLYTNFFTGISSNAQANFEEPEFELVSTQTTFTAHSFDSGTNLCEYRVTSVATSNNGEQYQVNGSLTVKRIDVVTVPASWFELDNAALKVGGTLSMVEKNTGVGVNGGDAILGALNLNQSWQCQVNGGNLLIDPNTAASINDTLTYISYSDPVINDLDMYLTEDTTINWSNVPDEPVAIMSAPGVNITINSTTVPDGIIYSGGDLTFSDGTVHSDLYCDGNMYISSGTASGDLYCRGDFTGGNAQVLGNLTCDGFADWSHGYITGYIYSQDGIHIEDASSTGSLITTGSLVTSSVGVLNAITYASGDLSIGDCSINSIIFSGGNAQITGGMWIGGALVVKGNLDYDAKSWVTISYNPSSVEDMLENNDYEFLQGESTTTTTLDEDIFGEQTITAAGRVS